MRDYITISIDFDRKKLAFQSGKYARFADGSAVASFGSEIPPFWLLL
jgi:polyribonucleotide nucleotidyltransferase